MQRKKLQIFGTVQGVGFRPAVYRLAVKYGLTGFVLNDSRGVTVEIQGSLADICGFIADLQNGSALGPAASIESLECEAIPLVTGGSNFEIRPSRSDNLPSCHVTADLALCGDCLKEMNDPADLRYGYPFINCTNCGPRYSIIRNIPYDRPNTTMAGFSMCQKCAGQYENISDRRFHAQPLACGNCGPQIQLTDNDGQILKSDCEKVITKAAEMLKQGKILAIKGIGGFHLAVDAFNEEAVKRLRQRKQRDEKPFALMSDSLEDIGRFCEISDAAKKALSSHNAPIVLLPRNDNEKLAVSVAPGMNSLGFMLCYAPLHYLLFQQGPQVLVMTSANISDEPLICKNEGAFARLANIADAFITHNREIYRQIDDSIVHMINNKPALIRRARGYVPQPIYIPNSQNNILALGSDLKNTFALVKKDQLICSEHIGDLENPAVYRHFAESIKHFSRLFEFSPDLIACDLHEGYFSTQFAASFGNIPVLPIQHHWAHIASVIAEHNTTGPVIGLACDGTGYGTDSAIWGGECLIADLDGFKRFAHLDYFKLAGGDLASKQAIRPAMGLLKYAYGSDFRLADFDDLLDPIESDKEKQVVILQQLDKNINTVETSSFGRLFDAVAAVIGLASENTFEAKLPMLLESIISPKIEQSYPYELNTSSHPVKIGLAGMIKEIVADRRRGISASIISTKFHNTLAEVLCKVAVAAREETAISTVALSGGVFCNRYLTERLIKLLNQNDLKVIVNSIVPSNDGGISVGQAAIAAHKK